MGAYINFDLVDTAELCGINIKRSTLTNDEVEARCPYCCDHRYRMYLSRLTNMFYCHNCGTGGNAVTLYSSFNPKGVCLKNYESYNALLNEPSVRRHDVPVEPEKSNAQIREISDRSEIYTGLLKLLRLEKEHFTNLLNRGLDSERIARNMYRSFPTDNAERQWICDSLAARYDLHGMPGFYRTDGIWHIAAFKSGILIPIRDKQNLIQGLQIRFDNPPVKRVTTPEGITIEKTGTRFMWLSSAKQKNFEGTSVPSYIHITGNRDSDTVYLTEGGLKSDVASYLSGDKLFIGLTGVQNTGFLKEVISSLSPKKIVEAVDMDVRSNPQVQKAQVKIQAICAPLCETYKRLFWPIDQKGIDDYMLFRKLKKEYEEKIQNEGKNQNENL